MSLAGSTGENRQVHGLSLLRNIPEERGKSTIQPSAEKRAQPESLVSVDVQERITRDCSLPLGLQQLGTGDDGALDNQAEWREEKEDGPDGYGEEWKGA